METEKLKHGLKGLCRDFEEREVHDYMHTLEEKDYYRLAGLAIEVVEALERQLAEALMDAAALRAEIDQYQDSRAATNEQGRARAKCDNANGCVCNLKDAFPSHGAPKPPCDGFFGTTDTCLNPDCGHLKTCHADQQESGQEKV